MKLRREEVEEEEILEQIERAIAEGRVYGKFRCPRCGMRSNDSTEAAECCKDVGPSASERVSDARFSR